MPDRSNDLERLRRALQPFSDAAPCYPDDFSPNLIVIPGSRVLAAHFRQAAKAYKANDSQAMISVLAHFAALSCDYKNRDGNDLVTPRCGPYWILPRDAPQPLVFVRDLRRAAESLTLEESYP